MYRNGRRSFRGRRAPFHYGSNSHSKFKRGYNRTSGYYRANPNSKELKFIDGFTQITTLSNQSLSASGINFITNGFTGADMSIIQDTGESDRIGRKILVKSIHLRGHWELPPTVISNQTADQIRLVIILDKQANGTQAVWDDVFADGAAQRAIWSYKKLSNSNRFVILKDFTSTINSMTLASITPGEVGDVERGFECHLSNLNIPVEYSGTAGIIGEVQSYNIFALLMTNVARIGIRVQIRTRFIG